MQKKIGIGIPVYNGESSIERAILSLLDQTHTNFRILISDNASLDGTEKLCRKFCQNDCRIVYVRQTENIGIGKNFQYVFENLNEEYFMWAAADDFWGNNFLKYNLENLENHSELVASISISRYENPFVQNIGDFSIAGKSVINRRFKYLINPGINARFHSIIRRSAINKLNLSDYSFVGADWALIYDLLEFGNFYRDERQIGFTKTANGKSSDIHNTIQLCRNKIIGYIIPLHELTIHILKNQGFWYLPLLIKHNIIYLLYSSPMIHKSLKYLKYKFQL